MLRLVAGGVLFCPLCAAAPALASSSGSGSSSAGHGGVRWGYEGEAGPEHWGELSPDMRVCSMGMEQTPIDLVGATRAVLAPVEPMFQAVQP
ncbi:MAG: hypothetical protein ACREER_11340, partial [Alphaproteobacteria bacterium]